MTATAAIPAVGTPMPDLALQAPDGSSTTLRAETAGSRSVVLFMRAASCQICLGHVASLERLDVDARAVVVVPGDAAGAASVASRVGSGVRVLASGDAHAAAGLGTFLTIQHSGTFVLDESGTVLAVRTATIPTGAFNAAEVVAALSS
jgi:peroxiredoxin